MSGARLRSAIDAAWTAAVLAALAVILRREIGTVLDHARADIDQRRREVEAEAKRMRDGRGYLAAIRADLIDEEFRVPIMRNPLNIDPCKDCPG